MKKIVISEKEGGTINCGPSGFIEVEYAVYGRTSTSTCGFNANTNCRAGNSWNYVYSRCQNKQTCYLKANNNEFGGPCPYVRKYLKVKFKCR